MNVTTDLCPCGHVLRMCHRENAQTYCPPLAEVRALPAGDTETAPLVHAALRWCSPGTASDHDAALEEIRSLLPDDPAVFEAIDMRRRAEAAESRLAQIAEIASRKARLAVAEPPSDTFTRICRLARGEEASE